MRGVLVLTGLLIGLAVAFLVAWPQLVEVPDLREQLAGILREASGTDLRLEGAVRLEVLPRPRITIERAVVAALMPDGARFLGWGQLAVGGLVGWAVAVAEAYRVGKLPPQPNTALGIICLSLMIFVNS